VLVGGAMVLGGGGSNNPGSELSVQLLFAGTLIAALVHPRWVNALHRPSWTVAAIVALVIALPVAQLVPLPPQIWRALPGRTLEAASLDLIGNGQNWMPLSLAPARTLAALLAMTCPVIVLIVVSTAGSAARAIVGMTIVVIAIGSILLGALQIDHLGGYSWLPYIAVPQGSLNGFQSGRNAAADILEIGLLALAFVGLDRSQDKAIPQPGLLLMVSGIALGAIAVLSTGSRTGLALLPVTLLFMLVILWPRLRPKIQNLRAWMVCSAIFIALVVAGLSRIGSVQRVLQRFSEVNDGRFGYWADTVTAIRTVWPAGSGIGTFPVVFQTYERLEKVSTLFTQRAHSDWLEWLLESGLAGVVVMIALGVLLAIFVTRAWRSRADAGNAKIRRGEIVFGIGTITILALHSIDDYPLRSLSLACLAAVAIGFIAPYQRHDRI